MVLKNKICFIGGGNMARAMIKGMLSAGVTASNISVTYRSNNTKEKLQNLGTINILLDNNIAIKNADIIVIAVKPKDFPYILKQIQDNLSEQQIIISIAAGITIETLSSYLKPAQIIIRAMPNTPVEIGLGVYGLFAPPCINIEIKQIISKTLELTGKIVWLDAESELDSLTCISGCGPAYVFMLISAFEQAGISLGLPENLAKIIAAQTVLGAGMLALNSSDSPSQLCKNVCSPGGVTEKGVNHLYANNFDQIIKEAIGMTNTYIKIS